MKHACLVCNKEIEFNTVAQYINHVNSCEESRKKHEAETKKQELEKEKKLRLEELETAYKNFDALLVKYQQDYHDPLVFTTKSAYPFGEVFSLLKNWPLGAL